MERYKIPVCYFPTTVLFVDDDRNYLSKLQLNLQVDRFFPKLFYSSQKALEFLQKDYHSKPFTHRCIHRPDELQLDHRNIDVDIPAIRQELYNLDRFSQISVVVADYAMPANDLNGLEFCKQLKNKPFKKIMLTGEADERIAVKAFNDGVIDRFIRKDASNFNELINETIYELQKQHFQELSTIVIDSLADPEFPIFTALDDSVFIKLFDEIVQKNDVTEYYLTDTYGSYVFLDIDANPKWLAVKDVDGMEGAYQIAKFSDTPFPPKILEEMKNRGKILYLYEEGGLSDDPDEVAKALHPAKKLEGRNTFYYALIKDPKAYDILGEKVTSYREYLDQHATKA